MSTFKLNRQIVTKYSFKTADDHVSFYADKTPHERMEHACFIINQIFTEEQRRVKRDVLTVRKHPRK